MMSFNLTLPLRLPSVSVPKTVILLERVYMAFLMKIPTNTQLGFGSLSSDGRAHPPKAAECHTLP